MKKAIPISVLVLTLAFVVFLISYVRITPPGKPKLGVTIKTIESIVVALERHKQDCGTYPTVEAGLKSLVTDAGVPGWQGPYLKHLPMDAWGQEFRYRLIDGKPEIRSAGPDMQFDTPDDFTNR